MKLLLSFLWVSFLSATALGTKSPFDYGVIIEYEDWAPEDNTGLAEDVKAMLSSNVQVNIVDVKPRIEISSSILRGFSANITGIGEDVTISLVQSKIQSLRVVEKVSPITLLYIVSPISTAPYSAPFPGRSNEGID
ncbi:hypothetical protein DL95DRAFT_400223 [Leptodontidium sp. 2 PMI_412]|nr:hypothetical protein DL95DRAFT_400223 [Leptodontidium sp. 2 PMI_412]